MWMKHVSQISRWRQGQVIGRGPHGSSIWSSRGRTGPLTHRWASICHQPYYPVASVLVTSKYKLTSQNVIHILSIASLRLDTIINQVEFKGMGWVNFSNFVVSQVYRWKTWKVQINFMISFILLPNFFHIVFTVVRAKSGSSRRPLGSVIAGYLWCLWGLSAYQVTILSWHLVSVYLAVPVFSYCK